MQSARLRIRAALAVLAAAACLLLLSASPPRAAAGSSASPLAPGTLVVADSEAFGNCNPSCGAVFAVNPSTGLQTDLSSNAMAVNQDSQYMNGPFTLAVDSDGDIVVGETNGLGGSCTGGCGGVVLVDPATGAQTILSDNAMAVNADSQYFGQVNGVAIDRAGDIIVSDWGGSMGAGKVISVNPTTGKETLISDNAMPVNADSRLFEYVQGLAIAPDGEIYVADSLAFGGIGHGGGIVGVDPVTGKETEVSANSMAVNADSQLFTGPAGVAVMPSGNLLVADWGGGGGSAGSLIEVDPATGKESVFSSNSMAVNADSQFFNEPVGVTIAPDGEIYVADENAFGPDCAGTPRSCGGIIAVDPSTRRETEVSSNLQAVNSADPLFVNPWSVAVVPAAVGSGTTGTKTGGSGSAHRIRSVKLRLLPRGSGIRVSFAVSGEKGRPRAHCQIDRHRPWTCTSPFVVHGVAAGRHVLAIRAAAHAPATRVRFRIRRHRRA